MTYFASLACPEITNANQNKVREKWLLLHCIDVGRSDEIGCPAPFPQARAAKAKRGQLGVAQIQACYVLTWVA